MESTLVRFVGTHTTEHVFVPTIDLDQVLYIIVSPYVPSAWQRALDAANITHLFPNLVHDITFGSPIGNPPPLTHTFIPPNLASANIQPEIINKELLDEVATSHMSGPFSTHDAHQIFKGHFRTSPVGLVEKVEGDRNWRMIRHLLKMDDLGFSTNDALNSDDFLTVYFSASHIAEWVSPCLLGVHHLLDCSLVFWCSGVLVFWCSGVHWCSSALMFVSVHCCCDHFMIFDCCVQSSICPC